MSAPCGFIRDGYSRPGYLKETVFYPALSFVYRPMLSTEFVPLMRRIAECGERPDPDGKTDKGAVQGEKLAQAEIVSRVKSWDLVDDLGAAVSITSENMAKVERHLCAELFNVVTGIRPSDKKDPSDADAPAEDASAKN